MLGAVSLFFAMQTQWRWVGVGMAGAMRTGLDYAPLPGIASAIPVDLTADVLHDLRTMESGALEVLNKR